MTEPTQLCYLCKNDLSDVQDCIEIGVGRLGQPIERLYMCTYPCAWYFIQVARIEMPEKLVFLDSDLKNRPS